MSREILRFGRFGFIEKDGRKCTVVTVLPASGNTGRRKLSNCRTRTLDDATNEFLGGKRPPSEANGWEIVKYPGECANHAGEYLLRSPYYDGLWKAYLTGNSDKYGTEEYSGFGWKAKLIKPEFNEDTWCDEVIFHTPEEVEKANAKPQTDLSFLNENRNELTAAGVVAAIVLIIAIARA